MEYDYDKVMHQVGRDGDTVLETMYSHAFGEKLIIMRVGNKVTITVIRGKYWADSEKVMCTFHGELPEGY